MLLSLNIKNILLIEDIGVDFGNNFNVITGETGSGKSVILESLLLALGARNISLSPLNNNKGYIIAEFDISKLPNVSEILHENEIEAEETLIIKRVISENGKSTCYINDVSVTVNLVKKIADTIIEVYGQHDFSSLLSNKKIINIIDEYSGNKKDLKKLSELYLNIKNLEKEKIKLKEEYERNVRDKEYLENACEELSKLDLQENEEEILSDKITEFKKSAKILESLNDAITIINENKITANLLGVIRGLSKITFEGEKKEVLDKILEQLNLSIDYVANSEQNLQDILDASDYSEKKREQIEERLYNIKDLARKYRLNSSELNNYYTEISAKLKLIKNSDAEILKIEKDIKENLENYNKLAKIISDKRKKSGKEIEAKVNREFPELKMKNAKFKINFSEKENISENGLDDAEFLIATNLNQNLEPISKVASGGEISRVMLALKIALSENYGSGCLIFDEIDTGISGSTAESVGKRLKLLSQKVQLIVITHQPQVASKADNHFIVEKKNHAKKSVINIRPLDKTEANKEVARLISGEDITEDAIKVASNLKQ
jgi:DNA repair protein RecN (Recombination protein N)